MLLLQFSIPDPFNPVWKPVVALSSCSFSASHRSLYVNWFALGGRIAKAFNLNSTNQHVEIRLLK